MDLAVQIGKSYPSPSQYLIVPSRTVTVVKIRLDPIYILHSNTYSTVALHIFSNLKENDHSVSIYDVFWLAENCLPFWYWNIVCYVEEHTYIIYQIVTTHLCAHTCWRHCLNLWVRAGETSPRSRWRWRRRAGIGATFSGFATNFYVPGSLFSALVQPCGTRTLFNTITFQLWSSRGGEEGKPGRQRYLSKSSFFLLLSLNMASTCQEGGILMKTTLLS